MWKQFNKGKSLGTKGSESGIIILDEEHIDGARITLERDGGAAPWSVTCGIYGSFLHTAFASSETEGLMKYEHMKTDLDQIMKEEDNDQRYQKMHNFAVKY